MTLKEITKQMGVVERTVRRWVEQECPHKYIIVNGVRKLDFDIEALATWRKERWGKD